jgi:lysyl-tRNA synthetase class 2
VADTRAAAPARPAPTDPWRPRVPLLVAWVVRVSALLTLLGTLRPGLGRDLDAVDALVPSGLVLASTITSAGLQLVLARGVRLRKRQAWALMLVATAVGAVGHVASRSWVDVVLNAGIFGLLLATRRDFPARSGPTTRWLAVRAFLLMAAASYGAGLLLTHRTAPDAPLRRQLTETFYGLFGFTPDLPFRRDSSSGLTSTTLAALGLLTLLVTVAVLLAPRPAEARLTVADEQRLRELLGAHGDRDSLGYFALRRDKSAVFSPSGKAAIGYRVIGGVSLASGDPIGDPEAWPGAIRAWCEHADAFGYVPGVLGAGEQAAESYSRHGFDALEIGDEAVLELCGFALEGRAMRPVRQAVNRVVRAGYTARVSRQGDLSPADLAEVVAAADRFRNGEVERGFSMALGRLGDPADPGLVLATAYDGDGHLVAVLGFVPWGTCGLSLDLMRRARDSENGTVEFLVCETAKALAGTPVQRLSLNFAVFRSTFERGGRIGAGPVLRVWRQVLMVASKWWQIESLYRANAKYQPTWVPRFVCFRKAADLPRIGIAGLEAEAFLVRPRLSRAIRL